MGRNNAVIAAAGAGLVMLTGCAGSSTQVVKTSTVTVTQPGQVQISTVYASPEPAPSTSAPRGGQSWSGNGTFSVGDTPRGGLKAAIPPGRYAAEVDEPGNFPIGTWIRCSSELCGLEYPENTLNIANIQGPSVMEILPTDVAVYLQNVTLTAVQQ